MGLIRNIQKVFVPLAFAVVQSAWAQPYPFQSERSNSAACLAKFQDTLSLANSYLVLPSTSGMARLDILQGGVKSNNPSAPLGSGKFSTVMYPVISTYGTPAGGIQASLDIGAGISLNADLSSDLILQMARTDNYGKFKCSVDKQKAVSFVITNTAQTCTTYFYTDNYCSDPANFSKKLADIMIPATTMPNIVYWDNSAQRSVELAGSSSMNKQQIIDGIGLGRAFIGQYSQNPGEGFISKCWGSVSVIYQPPTQNQGESNSDFQERQRLYDNSYSADLYLQAKSTHNTSLAWLNTIAPLVKDKTIGDLCKAVR